MAETTNTDAVLWVMDIKDPVDGDPLIESGDALIVAERTDEDEVAVHACQDGDDQATVTIYVTRARAALLAAQLMALAAADA